MSNIQKSIRIIKNEGFVSFLSKAEHYLRFKGRNLKSKTIRNTLLYKGRLRGYIVLEISGKKAKFVSNTLYSTKRTILRKKWEKDHIKDLMNHIKEEDVVYDIGANTGLYSCFISSLDQENRVVAFEPYPPNFKELEENIKLNNSSISVIKKALSHKEDIENLKVPDEACAGYGSPSLSPKGTGYEIEAIKGDSLIRKGKIPPPNIMKIDVEGAEYKVLEGLKETISKDGCRLIYCEIHLPKDGRTSIEDYGKNYKDIENLLESNNFKIAILEENKSSLFIKASKQNGE